VKMMMVANCSGKGRYDMKAILTLINAQIENSLEVGWKLDDIILLTNFDYSYNGWESTCLDLNEFCWTGSKMFGMKYLFDNNMVNETIWAKDLDCWQGVWFDEPEIKDVGAATYSRPTFNGGSVFWKPSSRDILENVIEKIVKNKSAKEEPTLNEVLKSKEYSDRVTVLNYTYNVGCSGYYERYTKSIKPIKVYHFHPYNRTAWETHCFDRNGIGERGLNPRLEALLRKYYHGLATELSNEGKISSTEKKNKREQSGKK